MHTQLAALINNTSSPNTKILKVKGKEKKSGRKRNGSSPLQNFHTCENHHSETTVVYETVPQRPNRGARRRKKYINTLHHFVIVVLRPPVDRRGEEDKINTGNSAKVKRCITPRGQYSTERLQVSGYGAAASLIQHGRKKGKERSGEREGKK